MRWRYAGFLGVQIQFLTSSAEIIVNGDGESPLSLRQNPGCPTSIILWESRVTWMSSSRFPTRVINFVSLFISSLAPVTGREESGLSIKSFWGSMTTKRTFKLIKHLSFLSFRVGKPPAPTQPHFQGST